MNQQGAGEIWRLSSLAWGLLATGAGLVGFVFYDGLRYLLRQWELPEYSYGYLIPVIALFFIWQRQHELRRARFEGSWLGTGLVLLGLLLFVAGTLGAVFSVVHYALVLVIAGAALACVGRPNFHSLWLALALLVFMIPLPGFLYQSLSNDLQLLSSRLGVGFIRLFGISVFLEGNVIDLGSLKLQVVEACSGLRYLFPLMTLGFIAGCFYKAPFWKRAVIFLSTIPITLLMNSLRIGVIGILVEYRGRDMAEGFLHDFEGWAIFMASSAVLVFEMWILGRLGTGRRRWSELFAIDFPPPVPAAAVVRRHPLPVPFLAVVALLAAAAVLRLTLPDDAMLVPARSSFSEFPPALGDWQGRRERLDSVYVESLNLDDYVVADFTRDRGPPVNLYIGYYATQNADKVPHSPRACIPGGGWSITDFARRTVAPAPGDAGPLHVNRAVIERGGYRQLVYYWFKQRDRILTHEFSVKGFIFWDVLTRRRSDGALVRLVTPVAEGEDLARADHRLASFAQALTPELAGYVPD